MGHLRDLSRKATLADPTLATYADSSPIYLRDLVPAKTLADTPRNGKRLIDSSFLLFEDYEEAFGLITSGRASSVYSLPFEKNLQTLDFRDIVIPAEDLAVSSLKGFISTPTFTSNDNQWSSADFDNETIAQGALDAHFGASQTLDYLYDNFYRNGLDNKGSTVLIAVAPKKLDEAGEVEDGHNAYYYQTFNYEGEKYAMVTLLDGVARSERAKERLGDIGLVASIDILAHELVHGLTHETADLVYRGESGALNESFSDIFGTNVKRIAMGTNSQGQPNWSWTLGENLFPARDMSNPNAFGHPDTYEGTFWLDPSSEFDRGGVHINSGVQNYWYALLTEGSGNNGAGLATPDLLLGSHENYTNDNGFNYNVKGIGFDKAQGVAYRALVNYLQEDSTFIDSREATIRAAIDLTDSSIANLYPGVPTLDFSDVDSVRDAWNAVGVGGGLSPEG